MKNFKLAFIIVAGLILSQLSSITAHAQLDDRERELELEQDNLQIHDIEAERKTAQHEAKLQEIEKARLKSELHKAELTKAITLKKSISANEQAELRRKAAVASQKIYREQIKALQQETRVIEIEMDKKSQAAKLAEDTAEAGRSEIENLRAKKAKLSQMLKQKSEEQQRAQNKMQRMKLQYSSLKAVNEGLENQMHRAPASNSQTK
jgi:chromosome segregation ATPase